MANKLKRKVKNILELEIEASSIMGRRCSEAILTCNLKVLAGCGLGVIQDTESWLDFLIF